MDDSEGPCLWVLYPLPSPELLIKKEKRILHALFGRIHPSTRPGGIANHGRVPGPYSRFTGSSASFSLITPQGN